MSKLSLLTAGAIGYVLGARAGRERYEQIASGARSFARNPKVQSVRRQAQDTLSEQAAAAGSAVADKARETASAAAHKVRSETNGSHSSEQWRSTP